jgi:hypothetical protein
MTALPASSISWNGMGTYWIRGIRAAAFEIGKFANGVWDALDDETRDKLASFDWEFVPALLRTIDFDGPYLSPPKLDAAIAAMKAKPVAFTEPSKRAPSALRREGASVASRDCSRPLGREA